MTDKCDIPSNDVVKRLRSGDFIRESVNDDIVDGRPSRELADYIERLTKALRIAELKASGTLANNLCPDHRDKQTGRPCLACEIERLTRYADDVRADCQKFQAEIERLTRELEASHQAEANAFRNRDSAGAEYDWLRAVLKQIAAKARTQSRRFTEETARNALLGIRPAAETRATIVYVCSNPKCVAIWESDPHGHCPACCYQTPAGMAGWSTMAVKARVVPTPLPAEETSESRDYAAARDAFDRTVQELDRYKQALQWANGFLIMNNLEPVKLEYQQNSQREGDNRDISAERCRNAASVPETSGSYSRSDPSEDARTSAGPGIASPATLTLPCGCTYTPVRHTCGQAEKTS